MPKQAALDDTDRYADAARQFKSRRRNHTFFIQLLPQACNPSACVYGSGDSRKLRLKTLPRSCDGYGMLIVSGFPVIRPANGVEQHKGTSKNGLLDRFAELASSAKGAHPSRRIPFEFLPRFMG